jgi:ketosteroid isomerase-like protein
MEPGGVPEEERRAGAAEVVGGDLTAVVAANADLHRRYVRRIDDRVEVLAANQAFYDAFEARDLDRMSDVWEHSDRAVCTHPGWSSLRGWAAIVSSFATLFHSPQSLQFLLTDAVVSVDAGTAWVSVDENLLGDQGGTTVAALNVFARTDAGWRMVVHHGSPVHVAHG